MIKVVYHPDFEQVYTSDPAAEAGRMESIVEALQDRVEWVNPQPAIPEQIVLAHSPAHMERVKARGLYPIAALAAGGALQAARLGLTEPAFALIRPPGHHASGDHSWGFCYFNNMAIALLTLKEEGLIRKALVLDIDLTTETAPSTFSANSPGWRSSIFPPAAGRPISNRWSNR